ncbi:MAG: AraC family transcriptional regulator [Eubacteriales bacterium]
MVLDCSIRQEGYPFQGIFLDKIFYIQGDRTYDTRRKVFSPDKKYFIYTLAGSGTIMVDEQPISVTANSYMHIVPSTHFSYYANGDLWEFWWYEYTGNPLRSVNTVGYATENSQMAFLLEHSFQYSKQGAWDVSTGMFLTLCALLEHCSVLYGVNHNDDGLFSAMDRHIRTNIQSATVADLVTNFKIEERSLRNLFHRQCNLPPKQYILKLRLEAACRLMLASKDSLQTIAMETGFSSAYHLSNCFKKQLSISPSQYRRKA